MKCLILAGGFGRRVQSIIGDRPKALLEYNGKPLISYIIERVPPDIEILVSTNKKFEADFLQWKQTVTRPVEVLVEEAMSEEQKLGALASISHWVLRRKIREDLLVLASDNYFEFDLGQFMAAYDGKNTLVAACDIGDEKKAQNFGVIRLDGRRIVEFAEKPAHPSSTLVATACYIFPERVLNMLIEYCLHGKQDLLGSFIGYLVEEDHVFAFPFEDRWFDIGNQIKKD
jgi:glucose-1-phosphate thymidylyltransferase